MSGVRQNEHECAQLSYKNPNHKKKTIKKKNTHKKETKQNNNTTLN